MKKILSTPIVQFLFFGALIFLAYYVLNPSESSDEDVILVDNSQLQRIVTIFQSQWNRNPTEEELEDLLNARINEEILYREALKMGLDHNDEIVKRRLSQKFEFLTSDMAHLKNPSDEELKAYYEKNKEKYLVDPTYSFAQIFIDVERKNVMDYARGIKKKVEGKEITNQLLEANSDMFPIALMVEKVEKSEIINRMGDDFFEKIKDLKLNEWSEPIQSAFGVHLVYPTEVVEFSEPDLDLINPVLKRDYLYDSQADINKNLIKEYRNNYTVDIQVDDAAIPQAIVDKLEGNDEK